jgi:hypothetical protein
VAVNWEKEQANFGRQTDAEIARRLGVSRERVRQKRLQVGIAAPCKKLRKRQWTSEEIALLGTMPDADVSARVGVSANHVAKQRRELGIFRYKDSVSRNPTISLDREVAEIIDEHRLPSETRGAFAKRLILALGEDGTLRDKILPLIRKKGVVQEASKLADLRPNTLADWIAGRGRENRKHPQRLKDDQIDRLAGACGLKIVVLKSRGIM